MKIQHINIDLTVEELEKINDKKPLNESEKQSYKLLKKWLMSGLSKDEKKIESLELDETIMPLMPVIHTVAEKIEKTQTLKEQGRKENRTKNIILAFKLLSTLPA